MTSEINYSINQTRGSYEQYQVLRSTRVSMQSCLWQYLIKLSRTSVKGRPSVYYIQKNMALLQQFRPWKSQGFPVFQVYACNCNL